mgnify:FL=1
MDNLKKLIQINQDRFKKLLNNQQSKKLKEGCYVYELEADTTIPSEFIMMMHFFGDINLGLQDKIVKYILKKQNDQGGWPLFHKGDTDLSASVKAYYALKLAGENVDSEYMVRAKSLILKLGGAEKVNVFTKISLAMFGQISWDSVPFMPIEIIRFPNWFPFNIYKISYWSRTVLVPLLVIMHRKVIASNPNNTSINELFVNSKNKFKKIKLSSEKNLSSKIFLIFDNLARMVFPLFPKSFKNKCELDAIKWTIERLNDKDGLGGIFPAMVNSVIALNSVNKIKYEKQITLANKAISRLIVDKQEFAYCQPCFSPIWDSGWMGIVHLENGLVPDDLTNWFLKKEIKTIGDWAHNKTNIKPGGWAFQFNNDYYPDVDDTALVGMFLDRYNKIRKRKAVSDAIERTRKWIIAMQSKNGGWGAFDIDNTHYLLNSIPFADHGALLDPPTADVSARCLSFLKQLNNPKDELFINKAVHYLLSQQEKNGSWYGRWGTNYIYGTWSVLSALNLVDFNGKEKVFDKATNYLKKMQRLDGGWGEDGKSYYKGSENTVKESTPSQTAWAVMGLLAAGQIHSPELEKGLRFLTNKNLKYEEDYYTAVGFPKVFYLKYHGYAKYFPLLAISKIKNQLEKNSILPEYGT